MKVVCHVHEAAGRGDFAHKISAKLVEKHGDICFEGLGINEIAGNRTLAKHIADIVEHVDAVYDVQG